MAKPCSVELLRCFRSDARISMDVYADSLGSALASLGHQVDQFVPHSRLERFASSRWLMRYLRYVQYPMSIRKVDRAISIQHVVDHGYAHLLPKLTAPIKICSAHDLIPFLNWRGLIETGSRTHSASGKKTVTLSKPSLGIHSLSFLERYDHIITVSASTAQDLRNYLGISAEKVSVIPPVLSPDYKPSSALEIEVIREKYGLPKDQKWVMLSGREFYKNHRTALAAIKQLKDRCQTKISVVKTGWKSDEFASLVDEAGLADCTRSVFVASEDMAGLYSTVDCLLFPSSYEGFGMPVAEALACGTPVVISDRASLPEVAPSLLQGVDAFDVVAMADKLEKALFDAHFQTTISEQGPKDMQRYSPAKVGGAMSRLYDGLLDF